MSIAHPDVALVVKETVGDMERRQREPQPSLTIRPLREDDLDAADAIMRRAFGSLFGMPDPNSFMGDAECVRTRWRADPASAFAAEIDGTLIGSAFANLWGSVGVVGPV